VTDDRDRLAAAARLDLEHAKADFQVAEHDQLDQNLTGLARL
jgi:hypothetical protein